MKPVLVVLLCSIGLQAETQADSARGAQLFETLSCVQCHSINGQGGKVGPDLGHRVDRGFTPSTLAATMWNHAPAMWAAMNQRGVRVGDLDEQAARDLFAYFYSARFFDQPGDAGRGKQVFTTRYCADCHGLTSAKIPEAKPVSEWASLGQPMDLVTAMWNHTGGMREEFAKRKYGWPALTTQDLADLLVYLRNLPSTRGAETRIAITSGDKGKDLFASKGCAACHSDEQALASHLQSMTLTGVAAAMWSHAPRMATPPPQFDINEMRELTSYLWAGAFFQDSGNARSGEKVYTSKGCGWCHANGTGGAPKLTGTGRRYSAATVVSSLWHHGPGMLDQMKSQGVFWPRFDRQDMANLIAYLNSGATR